MLERGTVDAEGDDDVPGFRETVCNFVRNQCPVGENLKRHLRMTVKQIEHVIPDEWLAAQ
jgi:hypothetical protein